VSERGGIIERQGMCLDTVVLPGRWGAVGEGDNRRALIQQAAGDMPPDKPERPSHGRLYRRRCTALNWWHCPT
jgi:hypothetical protein